MIQKIRLLIGLLLVSPVLLAFSGQPQAANEGGGLPWWVWLIILLILLVALIVLMSWLNGRIKKEKAEEAKLLESEFEEPAPSGESEEEAFAEEAEEEVEEVEEAAPEPAIPQTPDDLQRIEGIGPKISGLLQAAGVNTFAQLADTPLSRLDEILKEAKITIANPSTWAQQAKLAADGQWEELEALQGQLKGGRAV